MILKKIQYWLMSLGWIALGLAVFAFSSPGITYAQEIQTESIVLEAYDNMLISPVIERSEAFNSVIVQLDRAVEEMWVNYHPLEGGEWESFPVHDDGFGPNRLLFTSPSRTVQFRAAADGAGPLEMTANFLYTSDQYADADSEYLYAGPEVAAAQVKVISRKQWGADENLRYWTPEIEDLFRSNRKTNEYNNPCGDMDTKYAREVQISKYVKTGPTGQQLTWPLAYATRIRKIAVHHTDTDIRDLNGDLRTDSRDYRAMVQAIYYFHAISRGWGDIGYNYIIDPLGNIYEGRYGGDKVIGAHVQCYNNGILGIAIIGDYENKDVPQPALKSLINLMGQKSKQFGIDPQGESIMRGKRLRNIIGHRDVRSTSCPGKRLYAMLPRLRELTALSARSSSFRETTLTSQPLDYNAQSLSDPGTISLAPNQRKTITLRFKNTGRKTWDRNTWMHVALNNRSEARVVPVISDKVFVAADMKEKSVSPGQTATFEVEFEAGYIPGTYTFEVAPVVNGRFKVSRSAVFVPIKVDEPHFDYRVVKSNLPSGIVFQGQKIFATMKIQNLGNVKWVNYGNNPIRLGTEGLRDRRSLLVKKHTTRVAHLLESEVNPGETGTFVFDLEVPLNYTGKLRERFTPVIEGVRWMDNRGLGFEVTVKKPIHLARIVDKTRVPKMMPGEMRKIELTLLNKGDLTWDQSNMHINLLGTGINIFKKKLVPRDPVEPRREVDFDFWIEAPYKEGRHRIFLQSKFNRVPIRGGTARFLIDVPKPRLRAQMVEQSTRTVSVRPGEEKELRVKYKNLGNTVWRNKGENVIHLAPTRPQDRLSKLYYAADWENKYRAVTMDEDEVKPGEIGTFRFKIRPKNYGLYRENFQLVVEWVGWIDASFVRWDVRVAGSRMTSSSGTINNDALQNQARAAIITKATAPVSTVTMTTSSTSSKGATISFDETTQTERLFRVRLSYEADVSKVTADKDFKVIGQSGNTLFEVGAGTSVELRRLHDNIHVQLGSTVKTTSLVRIVPSAGGIVEVVSWERRPSWNRNLNDNRFRGILEVRPVNGNTAYINELPLEDYLKGLAEVSNDTLPEKQKAIAVLARTYARYYMQDENRKFPGLPYDGSDDPAIFQRYLGYGYEIRSPNFLASAAVTEDMVVTYLGQLIKTPYFSQSDGRTLSALEAFGWTHTPYLQSVDDPYCAGLIRRGHGVGMSGCGAEGMAKAGKTYEEIIKYYYQGVEIEKRSF